MKEGIRKTKASDGDVPGAYHELPKAGSNYVWCFCLRRQESILDALPSNLKYLLVHSSQDQLTIKPIWNASFPKMSTK